MISAGRPWLIAAGVLDALAALLHVACIFGGPAWYRFLGAGERMAQLAERGDFRAVRVTLLIAAVLAGWAAYAFSGAGLLPRLPLLRTGLVAITTVYLLRGLVPIPMALLRPEMLSGFWLWSSAIVLVFGIVHAIGTWASWDSLR